MQAIADPIGLTAPEQKTLRYKFLGVPPLTPEQFVENDILEVIQLGVSRIEHLPTASHKTKTRDEVLDVPRIEHLPDDDGGKRGGSEVGEGGKGERVSIKTEDDDGGKRGGRVGGGRKFIKAEEKEEEVIDLTNEE
ncbi:hypothetical protein HK104_004427 [Borealophlyctis nickersoniae]|nr:hypothetical protein HK104_004427 [Borealophlyctis nickersoniae]